MKTASMSNNGRMNRKTLSSQIDRLDSMLDGLADGLHDAVAMTVKDVIGRVVREAVAGAVKEVLANPDLLRVSLAQHAPVAAAAPPPKPPNHGTGRFRSALSCPACLQRR